MNQPISNLEEILDSHISGFHRIVLTEPVHLCYASRNLGQILGISPEELLSETQDLYAGHVHPADTGIYRDFLTRLQSGEQTLTARYRLVKSDGTSISVLDSVTTKYLSSGILVGDSVLTDITQIRQENQNLQFLNETMPCGLLKYTCEKFPKITYVNQQMLSFLGVSGAEAELYRQNIYMAIPFEERRKFAGYLDRVREQGIPIAGEITVQHPDGTRVRLFGWVTVGVNAAGEEEFQSVCMDITRRYQEQKLRESTRYLRALTEVYDKIFEYDRAERTVKCLHGGNSPMFRWAENIPMPMEQTTRQWIADTVIPEDRERMGAFFETFYQDPARTDTPPVIRYRALSSSGALKTYSGLFVKLDSAASLFCCRCLQEQEDADTLRSENDSLKGINENMQKIVMHFTDGLAAFEVLDDMVTPLYASDNVCQFFGYTRDQWLSIMQKRTPIDEFLSYSRTDYGDFMELLRQGEAEFTYEDLRAEKKRRIKAVCSRRSSDASAPMYVMLYHVDEDAKPENAACRVRIRTFGYFDVFVDDKPIAFRNEKSKELFALLVDRNGGFVSSEEAISYLWEDEPANSVTLARYRKVALRLKNILEEYGIADIVESVNGKRRLVTEKVSCDLYDYLSGREEYAQLFKGSYLSNYSWGETTLANLMGENLL